MLLVDNFKSESKKYFGMVERTVVILAVFDSANVRK